MSSSNPSPSTAKESTLKRDKSRNRKPQGMRQCTICRIPFAFYNRNAQFCSDRCRQRRHRGHVDSRTIRRSAAGFFCGQLSDRTDDDFLS